MEKAFWNDIKLGAAVAVLSALFVAVFAGTVFSYAYLGPLSAMVILFLEIVLAFGIGNALLKKFI